MGGLYSDVRPIQAAYYTWEPMLPREVLGIQGKLITGGEMDVPTVDRTQIVSDISYGATDR